MSSAGARSLAWAIVPPSPERFDGIRDFAEHLSAALAPALDVRGFTAAGDAAPGSATRVLAGWGELPRDAPPNAILVHYAPQQYLRADTRALLARLRAARGAGARVVLIVHEYQLDPGPSLARRAGRFVFARLARAFAAASTSIVTSHGFVARWLEQDGLGRYAPITTIPIGTNVPEPAPARTWEGAGIVMFGQPAGMSAPMVRAGLDVAAQARATLTWICRREEESRAWLRAQGIADDRLRVAAGLDAHAVSRELSAASIGFAPIVDGVSTRRSTLPALAQHRLPVAGSDGRATDPLFRETEGFALAPLSEPAAIQKHLRELIASEHARARMGEAARALFDAHLSWPRIAEQYLRLAV